MVTYTQKLDHYNTDCFIYIYIYIYGEMVDFGKADKMIKISGKGDKPNTGLFTYFYDIYKIIMNLIHYYFKKIKASPRKKSHS